MSPSDKGEDKSLKRLFLRRKRSEGTSSQSTPEHGAKEPGEIDSEIRRVVSDICDGLITVLGVAKEASAAFPPLQSALGGVLEVCKVFKV